MRKTQTKIEEYISNIVYERDVTNDKLLHQLFSWILGSFNRPLPRQFQREFDAGFFKPNKLKENVAQGQNCDEYFEFLDDLLGYALGLQAQGIRTSDDSRQMHNACSIFHKIIDIWLIDIKLEDEKRAKDAATRKAEQDEAEVPQVPVQVKDDKAWDYEDKDGPWHEKTTPEQNSVVNQKYLRFR
jgi:hypothetical protein